MGLGEWNVGRGINHLADLEDQNAKLIHENFALRKEVNSLRAQMGMGRKYLEWNEGKPQGGCPTSGG
jgi:regulator of replication initiation timing